MVLCCSRFPVRSFTTTIIIVVLLSLAAMAGAQAHVCRKPTQTHRPVYSSRGLFFSLAPGWADFDGEFTGLDSRHRGRSGRLMVSYGLSQRIAFFLNLEGAVIEDSFDGDWGMGFVDIGIKYTFTPSVFHKTRLYLLGSIGAAGLAEDNDFDGADPEYRGGTARLAIGVDHFISRKVMLFAELGHRGGTYDRVVRYDIETDLLHERDFSSTGFHVGLRLGL